MPRIITGLYKGKLLMTPEGREVRPTSDRVRTSIFNILHSWLPGRTVLDLYAGCGAVGLECLSRGARKALMVERAPEAYRCLEFNVQNLKAGSAAQPWRGDVWELLAKGRGTPVDLVYADPPYREVEMERLLEALEQSGYAGPDTILILEHDETVRCEKGFECAGWRCYRHNDYGKARASFFGRIESFQEEEEETTETQEGK